MARPRKDKFDETSIGFKKGTEHELVYVSAPFFSKVTYKVKVAQDNKGKLFYGTTSEIIQSLHYTQDEIKKLFREKNAKVIKIEEATIRLPNICEKCHRKGVPIIQKKSNLDYHYRSSTNKIKTDTGRHDEYWLNYQHTTKPKICRIAQFDEKRFQFKNPKNRITELHKHFFPRYLEWIEKELVA